MTTTFQTIEEIDISSFFGFLGVTFGVGDIACAHSHTIFNLLEVKD